MIVPEGPAALSVFIVLIAFDIMSVVILITGPLSKALKNVYIYVKTTEIGTAIEQPSTCFNNAPLTEITHHL